MIVTGATAYPRIFDFNAFKKICDEIGALLLADISHFEIGRASCRERV